MKYALTNYYEESLKKWQFEGISREEYMQAIDTIDAYIEASDLDLGVASWDEEQNGYVIPIENTTSENKKEIVGNILLGNRGISLQQRKTVDFSDSYIGFSAYGENISGSLSDFVDESNSVTIIFDQEGYRFDVNHHLEDKTIPYVTKPGSEKIKEVMNALTLTKNIVASQKLSENKTL